jgi:SNF2 family DNA or RNA helicase
MGPTLSFKKGRFILSEAQASHRKVLNQSAYWEKGSDDVYTTTSLQAASAFRRHSDSGALKIFTRAFQEFYDLPRRARLAYEGGHLNFLDPHQWSGVQWALTRKRSYLAHAPGAGKTMELIVTSILTEARGQTVIIVPPSLTVNWAREIYSVCERFGIWPSIGLIPGSALQDHMGWGADYILVPDSMLTKPWVYTRLSHMRKKMIAIDEASRFKDPFAERSLAFYGGRSKDTAYSGLFQDAAHVVLLDGSPVLNRPIELWAPTFALDPQAIDCMSMDDFGYRYCGPQITERGQYTFLHSSHEEELHQKITKSFMHVVTEDKLEHPERRRSILFMNQDVRTAEMKSWEAKNIGSDFKVESPGNEAGDQGEFSRLRKQLGLLKVPFIGRYVWERLNQKNESILLFVWHREVAEQLTLDLVDFNPGLVIGGTHARERERYFAEFQSGKRKLIIGNITAMERGHNLQNADRVIFGEFSWTDEQNKQCEKRASRRGSEKAFVRCEYICCPNSIDEVVLRSNFTKHKRVKRIIG